MLATSSPRGPRRRKSNASATAAAAAKTARRRGRRRRQQLRRRLSVVVFASLGVVLVLLVVALLPDSVAPFLQVQVPVVPPPPPPPRRRRAATSVVVLVLPRRRSSSFVPSSFLFSSSARDAAVDAAPPSRGRNSASGSSTSSSGDGDDDDGADNANDEDRFRTTDASSSSSSSSTTTATATDSSSSSSSSLLLETVTKTQLAEFCATFRLSRTGTKEQLLARLQEYGRKQVREERRRLLARKARVEGDVREEGQLDDDDGGGGGNSKERYEIVDDDNDEYGSTDDDEEDEFAIYFPLSGTATVDEEEKNERSFDGQANSNKNFTSPEASSLSKGEAPGKNQNGRRKGGAPYLSSDAVVAAPPPDAAPNERGERTVTVYSTTDQNDLTGIAAAQPGAAAGDSLNDAAAAGASSSSSRGQPWDMQHGKSATTSSKETEQAKESIVELVQTLLSTTGAPAFSSSFLDGNDGDDQNEMLTEMPSSYEPPKQFVGFNPTQVPTDLLASSSQALRTGRGQVLQEVLRQFELQAVGQDGVAGDDIEKGGGHYREVAKVRAFLEGYRRAEVRRIARETATLLLDKLVQEGVEGLDLALMSMTRSNDDTGDHANELNDSLVDFLSDAIRQQERNVEQLLAARRHLEGGSNAANSLNDDGYDEKEEDPVDSLWKIETEEDGERVETIDPKDPQVQRVLREEQLKSEISDMDDRSAGTGAAAAAAIPNSPSEKLLLLLKLLRDRLKAEAAFAPDEKGKNLRLLAYCLRLPSGEEREQLILKDIGNSLDVSIMAEGDFSSAGFFVDPRILTVFFCSATFLFLLYQRLDSFLELVASSIEYGESTTHQLQPSTRTRQPLNVKRLRSIQQLAKDIRLRQSRKASGVRP